eukprot:4680771-Pyramimonas_sp.AAC.1
MRGAVCNARIGECRAHRLSRTSPAMPVFVKIIIGPRRPRDLLMHRVVDRGAFVDASSVALLFARV